MSFGTALEELRDGVTRRGMKRQPTRGDCNFPWTPRRFYVLKALTMHLVTRQGVAALTAALIMPSLARADVLAEPPATDPFADEAQAGDTPTGEETVGGSAPDAPPGVTNPELAAAAPQPSWNYEGGGGGGVSEGDPRVLNRKIRTAGKVTLAGGGIALLGGVTAISGAVILYAVRPSSRLSSYASDNMGALPTDDSKRHRLITLNQTAPVLVFAGLGVLVTGAIIAAVGRIRFKKLREKRRTSTVAFAPAPAALGRGVEMHLEVRF